MSSTYAWTAPGAGPNNSPGLHPPAGGVRLNRPTLCPYRHHQATLTDANVGLAPPRQSAPVTKACPPLPRQQRQPHQSRGRLRETGRLGRDLVEATFAKVLGEPVGWSQACVSGWTRVRWGGTEFRLESLEARSSAKVGRAGSGGAWARVACWARQAASRRPRLVAGGPWWRISWSMAFQSAVA